MRRHLAQHPFAERLAADEYHLLAGGIIAQRVENAPQARTVQSDRRVPELFNVDSVGLGIDAIGHWRFAEDRDTYNNRSLAKRKSFASVIAVVTGL